VESQTAGTAGNHPSRKATFDNYEVEHEIFCHRQAYNAFECPAEFKEYGQGKDHLLPLRDITERKEIESRLEKTRKELALLKKPQMKSVNC